jgi:biopolymer transport protein ExbD
VSQRRIFSESALGRQRERLDDDQHNMLLVILFPFGLAVLFLFYCCVDFNYRLGTESIPPELGVQIQETPALWLSVRVEGDDIQVTTRDLRTFKWNGAKDEDYQNFKKYILDSTAQIVSDSILQKKIHDDFAVISADEKTSYRHLATIVYALAEAGISRYGLEARPIATTAAHGH